MNCWVNPLSRFDDTAKQPPHNCSCGSTDACSDDIPGDPLQGRDEPRARHGLGNMSPAVLSKSDIAYLEDGPVTLESFAVDEPLAIQTVAGSYDVYKC